MHPAAPPGAPCIVTIGRLGHAVFRRLGELPVPTFALVNGAAMSSPATNACKSEKARPCLPLARAARHSRALRPPRLSRPPQNGRRSKRLGLVLNDGQ